MSRSLLRSLLILLFFSSYAVQAQDQTQSKGTFVPHLNWTSAEPATAAYKMGATIVAFQEDFESGAAGWGVESAWEVGMPTTGPASGYLSDNAAGTDLDALYANGAAYRLTSPVIDLSAYPSTSEIELSFYEWFSTESSYDYGYVQFSADGSTWTTGNARHGSSDWRGQVFDVSAYGGGSLWVSFYFTSDGSNVSDGWFIDDVAVTVTEPEDLTADLLSLNSGRFPYIFLNSLILHLGETPLDLTPGNLTITESGILQTDNVTLVPPDMGGGVRLADFVFVIDDTGSMGGEIASVRDNVIAFADALATSGIDYALGLATYKDDVTMRNSGLFTSSVSEFQGWVAGLSATGGLGIAENGFAAIEMAVGGFAFRPGAQRIVVIMTDAPSWEITDGPSYESDPVTPEPPSLADLVTFLNASGVTTYAAAISTGQYSGPGSITEETGGRFYNLSDPLTGILTDIGEATAAPYVISYRSSNPVFDGMEREVCLVVDYLGATSETVCGRYTPGAAPRIRRTAATRDLSLIPFAEFSTLSIEAEVTDAVAPFVTDVTLYYRHVGDASFSSVAMTHLTGDFYSALIPVGAVTNPGVEYFIRATDGGATSSDPSSNPDSAPYQIAVLPNVAPDVIHTPIDGVEPGVGTAVKATATDGTNTLDSVELAYRPGGGLLYTWVDMAPIGGDDFEFVIPGTSIDERGIEYFIVAMDDLGLSTSVGSADDPIFAGVLGAEVTVTLSDAMCGPGGPVEIPVLVSDLDGLGLYGFDFTVLFDPAVLDITDYFTEGSLTHDRFVAMGFPDVGAASLGAAGSVPFTGSGLLVTLTGTCVSTGLAESVVEWGAFHFDNPADVSLVNGTVSVVGYGDVNQDGFVGIADVTMLLRYFVDDPLVPTVPCYDCGDVDGDGDVTVGDALLILRYVVSDIGCFPVIPSCSVSSKGMAFSDAAYDLDRMITSLDGDAEGKYVFTVDLSKSEGLALRFDWDVASDETMSIDVEGFAEAGWLAAKNVTDRKARFVAIGRTASSPTLARVTVMRAMKRGESAPSITLETTDGRNRSLQADGESTAALSVGAYPNPFNPATTIQYELAEQTHIQLRVYNALGAQVMELQNDVMSPGSHRVTFDASSLPSGVYYCTVQTNEGSKSIPLILVR